MESVSKSGHRLYTLSPSSAVSRTRTASRSSLLRRPPLHPVRVFQKYPRMIDARDPSELFLPSLVSSSVPHPRSPRASRPSYVAQEPPLDCCPVRSSSSSPGCPVSYLPDTSSRCLPNKRCAVYWRDLAVPFQCTSAQRTPKIPIPNVRRRAQG